MMVERGNHLIWRSQDLNKEMSGHYRLHANHVPSGIMINLDECSCTHTKNIIEHVVKWYVYQRDLTTE
jgi:hypothetical protein